MRLLLLAVVLGVSLSGCRVYDLQDGPYQFTLKEVLRDDCGLATAPAVMSTGVLTTTGALVNMKYGYLETELVGAYLVDSQAMMLDGFGANVMTEVRGQTCLLDTAGIHIETHPASSTAFTGEMSIELNAKAATACVCKVWLTFEAKKK